MRFILLVILIALATGCTGNNSVSQPERSPKSKLVHEISDEVFKQLKVKKNLYPCECGGRMMDQIKLLHWGFDYYNDIDIEEGRELLVTAANLLLKAINEDERIRPYLATYPFMPENIEIRIFLHNPDGSLLGPEKLHVVSILEGILNYKVEDAETHLLRKVLKETFEEAEGKLNVPLQKAI